jgi:hypothetical protein
MDLSVAIDLFEVSRGLGTWILLKTREITEIGLQ